MRFHASSTDRLFTLFKMRGCIYVVVDRYNGDPFAASGEATKADYLALHDQAFANQPDRTPTLIRLDWNEPRHHCAFEWSLEHARREWQQTPWRPSICAWACARQDSKSALLIDHLSKSLRCSLQPGSTSYLRYFDPRVFPRLAQILGHVRFVEPLDDWHQLDRDGSMIYVSGAEQLETPPSALPLRLWEEGSRGAVLRIELMSRIAATVGLRGRTLRHADNDGIDKALLAAASFGLINDEDRIAFATHSLIDGEAFDRHADLAAWCSHASTHGIPFEAVLDAGASPLSASLS